MSQCHREHSVRGGTDVDAHKLRDSPVPAHSTNKCAILSSSGEMIAGSIAAASLALDY